MILCAGRIDGELVGGALLPPKGIRRGGSQRKADRAAAAGGAGARQGRAHVRRCGCAEQRCRDVQPVEDGSEGRPAQVPAGPMQACHLHVTSNLMQPGTDMQQHAQRHMEAKLAGCDSVFPEPPASLHMRLLCCCRRRLLEGAQGWERRGGQGMHAFEDALGVALLGEEGLLGRQGRRLRQEMGRPMKGVRDESKHRAQGAHVGGAKVAGGHASKTEGPAAGGGNAAGAGPVTAASADPRTGQAAGGGNAAAKKPSLAAGGISGAMGLAAGGNAAGQVTGPEEQAGAAGALSDAEDQARVAAFLTLAQSVRGNTMDAEVGYLDPAKAPPVPGAALQP